MKTFLFLSFIIVLYLPHSFCQDTPAKIVDIVLNNNLSPVKAGEIIEFDIKLKIKQGWHINAEKPFDNNLTPTMVTLKTNPDFKVVSITYPEPHILKLEFSEDDLALYEDEAIIKIKVKIEEAFKKEKIIIDGTVRYQPCNDQTCLFPYSKTFKAELKGI